jgi:hypothetical protein
VFSVVCLRAKLVCLTLDFFFTALQDWSYENNLRDTFSSDFYSLICNSWATNCRYIKVQVFHTQEAYDAFVRQHDGRRWCNIFKIEEVPWLEWLMESTLCSQYTFPTNLEFMWVVNYCNTERCTAYVVTDTEGYSRVVCETQMLLLPVVSEEKDTFPLAAMEDLLALCHDSRFSKFFPMPTVSSGVESYGRAPSEVIWTVCALLPFAEPVSNSERESYTFPKYCRRDFSTQLSDYDMHPKEIESDSSFNDLSLMRKDSNVVTTVLAEGSVLIPASTTAMQATASSASRNNLYHPQALGPAPNQSASFSPMTDPSHPSVPESLIFPPLPDQAAFSSLETGHSPLSVSVSLIVTPVPDQAAPYLSETCPSPLFVTSSLIVTPVPDQAASFLLEIGHSPLSVPVSLSATPVPDQAAPLSETCPLPLSVPKSPVQSVPNQAASSSPERIIVPETPIASPRDHPASPTPKACHLPISLPESPITSPLPNKSEAVLQTTPSTTVESHIALPVNNLEPNLHKKSPTLLSEEYFSNDTRAAVYVPMNTHSFLQDQITLLLSSRSYKNRSKNVNARTKVVDIEIDSDVSETAERESQASNKRRKLTGD